MTWTVPSYLCVHIFLFHCVLDRANERTHKAGLFSAALTGLVIDRSQAIQPTPALQSAFFQKQSALLLNQISQQLSSLSAQAPISPDISLSDPTVNPSASDVRVNICWFMSLVFSLSAALLATLVQQWAQDYMHMFQLYSTPLDIARIRQYLHDGVKRWGMPTTVEAVPGLIHFSLLLFFIGLADFLLNAYPIVGKFTLFPITFCVTLYIISTFAPIIDPQSPYRTSLSRLVWYLARTVHPRPYVDRFGKKTTAPLSSNMVEGQMQLAVEKNDKRWDRDEKAIKWLIEKLAGDADTECFTLGIPGSFNSQWGQDVWNKLGGLHTPTPPPRTVTVPSANAAHNDDQLHILGQPVTQEAVAHVPRQHRWPLTCIRSHPRSINNGPGSPAAPSPPPPPQQRLSSISLEGPPVDVNELCKRILHLVKTYDSRSHFVDKDDWCKRSRAIVEAAASFVFHMKVNLEEFRELGKFLSDLGKAEQTNEWSETNLNRSFIMRWTCLSIVTTREMLKNKRLGKCADANIGLLALCDAAVEHEEVSDTGDSALRNAKKIDNHFEKACDCLDNLYSGLQLREGKEAIAEVDRTLADYADELKDTHVDAHDMGLIDKGILALQSEIDEVTHQLIRRLPGVALDTHPGLGHTPLTDIFGFISDPIGPQLLYLRHRLQGLRSTDVQDIRAVVSRIREKITTSTRVVVHKQRPMERQLWRLQDISAGSAFGFTLELYFLALRQLLPSSHSSRDFTTFYIGAFKNITSDWTDQKDSPKDSPGTQQIILNLVCDIGVPDCGIFSNFSYPEDITTELVNLLPKMIEGKLDTHDKAATATRAAMRSALDELREVRFKLGNDKFRVLARDTIAKSLHPSSVPSINGDVLPGLEQL